MGGNGSFLLLSAAVFLGAFVSGFAGFAFSAVAGGILLHTLLPMEVVPLMMAAVSGSSRPIVMSANIKGRCAFGCQNQHLGCRLPLKALLCIFRQSRDVVPGIVKRSEHATVDPAESGLVYL